MRHGIEFLAPTLLAALLAAAVPGCFGDSDDQKPRPDFMSRPAATESGAGAQSSADPTEDSRQNGDASGTRVTRRSDRQDGAEDAPPGSDADTADEDERVFLTEDESAWDDDVRDPFFDDEEPWVADEPTDSAYDDSAREDDYADEDLQDEDEEPLEMLGAYPVRVPRPLPVDDLPPVAADVPDPPTPGQVAKAAAPWKPKSQDEIERLRARERAADLTPEQIDRLPKPLEIPVPPNPFDE